MAMLQTTFLQQWPSLSAYPHSFPYWSSSSATSTICSFSLVKVKVYACCQTSSMPMSVVNGNADLRVPQRSEVRLGLPSKGRMASDTLDLLKDCQLSVKQVNPRQYVAQIPQEPCLFQTKILLLATEKRKLKLSNLEVWFQRPKDIVKKLLSGDLDLGMVGLDTLCEYGQGSNDLVIVHDDLDYGQCHLSFAIPKYGIFENINSIKELAEMPQWTAERPLRVATGFTYLGPKFMKENGLKHVTFSTADGALEAAPAMGIADAILDLVSSGTTLKENNLKEIEGGVVLQSQAVLVGSRKSLTCREGVLDITHEMLERFEAHLRAVGQFTVTANMRGSSAEEVAERILSQASLSGLQGPTVSPVFCKKDGKVLADYYAIVICVPKKALYKAVQQLRAVMLFPLEFFLSCYHLPLVALSLKGQAQGEPLLCLKEIGHSGGREEHTPHESVQFSSS
ncbi:hypothetical protein Cgig2_023757 [Carnegiea gigantea]|uniref:ATP phosphoribosyltransferase n=1 Tax=Carnegiea gigantea TaxID=171969 RepID=A0A9Q1KDP9_9CARY|nr:hypothetical protein Cgig2_023757 [Carnegiea gigantea]